VASHFKELGKNYRNHLSPTDELLCCKCNRSK